MPLRGQRVARAPLRDHQEQGRLQLLPRRDRPAVPAQQARAATGRQRSERANLQRVPRRPSHSWPAEPGIGHIRHKRSGVVRALPSRRTEGSRPLHRNAARDHPALHRKHSRQRPAQERSHRDRYVHELPHRPRRAAKERSGFHGKPEECPIHLRQVPPRHSGAVRAEHSFGERDQDWPGVAGVQRLSQCPLHPPRRRGWLQAGNHEQVRALPRRDRQDLFRDLSRQGLATGLHQDRQVLRLSRGARHPEGHRSPVALEPRQCGGHLPPVPQRRHPPLRRIPDPRHPPRPQEVSVPVLVVLGDDGAAGGDLRGGRGAHAAVAAPRGRDAPRTAGGRGGGAQAAVAGGERCKTPTN